MEYTRSGCGGGGAVSADPAGVEEEYSEYEDDGEEYEDKEDCAAANMEVLVVEVAVMPVL